MPGVEMRASARARVRGWAMGRTLPLAALALLGGCAFLRAPESVSVAPAPPPSFNTFVLDPQSEVVGQLWSVPVVGEETLLDVARRYDLGYDEIVAANPMLDPWVPEAGAQVLLPGAHVLPDAPREGIVLNLPAKRLYYYPPAAPAQPRRVVTHPIGIGREGWGTPLGRTEVAVKHVGPSWTVPASIRREHAALGDPLPAVVPPGPDNPLGIHALRLGWRSYLIHGTNKPAGIGMRVSHGCIQLYPEDIRSLFDAVPEGTPVRVVNQPYLAGRGPQGLMLEVHAPLEEHHPGEAGQARAVQAVLAAALARHRLAPETLDLPRALEYARAAPGYPLPVTRGAPAQELLVAGAAPAPPLPDPDGAPRPAGQGEWVVDLGSYRYANNVRRLMAMLDHLGPPMPARRLDMGEQTAVLAGPYPTRAQAQAAARRIARELQVDGTVRREPSAAAREGPGGQS